MHAPSIAIAPRKPSGSLPRLLSPDFLWCGACPEVSYRGETVHGQWGVYVVRTPSGTYLVDTGHPITGDEVSEQLDAFLGDEPVRFIFPTHPEIPHAGLLSRWLRKYPDAIVIGDARDYQLYYPDEVAQGRFWHFAAGEALQLADRRLTFVPAIWRDLPTTLWLHDDFLETLFVADAFAFLHPHNAGECDKLTSERDSPSLVMAQFFNNAALFWTRVADVAATFPDIDELLRRLSPRLIAPAHGAVCDSVDELVPFFKQSMVSR
jgi:flavorubredoxin